MKIALQSGSYGRARHFVRAVFRITQRRARSDAPYQSSCSHRAFTLMEIMLVIGILAIVITMAIPPIYRGMSKEPMRQAVSGVLDACTAARAQAILTGKTTAVVFHPQERTFAAEGGSVGPKPGASLSGKFSDAVGIEMLDINLLEYRESEIGRVRFFPNGTCDEFTLILHSDKGEWRKLSLEPTTGILTMGDVR